MAQRQKGWCSLQALPVPGKGTKFGLGNSSIKAFGSAAVEEDYQNYNFGGTEAERLVLSPSTARCRKWKSLAEWQLLRH